MLSFTLTAFILILFAIFVAGAAVGVWMVISYEPPKEPAKGYVGKK